MSNDKYIFMKVIYFIILTAIVVSSCTTRSGKELQPAPEEKAAQTSGPTVGKKDLLGKVTGSAYLERATGYFLMADGDTSSFMPVFSEFKETGRVSLNLNLPYAGMDTSHAGMTTNTISNPKPYSQWIKELEMILSVASGDYITDSIRSISVGRLILTGDMAIEITGQYKNIYGSNERITTAEYWEISRFLMTTPLASDFNRLLEPYSLKISSVSIEKAMFTTKEDLLNNSVIETSPAEIPETILDCITWFIIEMK